MVINCEYSETPAAVYALPERAELKLWANVSAEALAAYTARLDAIPELTLYATREIGPNRYRTYRKKGGGMVHVSYFAPDCSLRVVTDPLNGKCRDLPPLKAPSYEKICEPSLTVVPLDYSKQRLNDANGMSYVLLLEDGSFVIYDGGYMEDAPRLYAYLLDHTPLPDGRVEIAAWVMTHSHGDHYNCLVAFSRLYAPDVHVRCFIANAPLADPTVIRPDRVDGFLNERFYECVACFEGARVIRLRTGQVFPLPGAQIEVLQTYEDIVPVVMDYLNEASIVTMVTIGGQKILFPGDAELKADERLKRLGPALKCDFFQVAHHGWSGGTPELFAAADPAYLLWTTNYECYSFRTLPIWRHGHFTRLLNGEHILGSFVADGAFKILPLPLTDFLNQMEYYRPRDLLDVLREKGLEDQQ